MTMHLNPSNTLETLLGRTSEMLTDLLMPHLIMVDIRPDGGMCLHGPTLVDAVATLASFDAPYPPFEGERWVMVPEAQGALDDLLRRLDDPGVRGLVCWRRSPEEAPRLACSAGYPEGDARDDMVEYVRDQMYMLIGHTGPDAETVRRSMEEARRRAEQHHRRNLKVDGPDIEEEGHR